MRIWMRRLLMLNQYMAVQNMIGAWASKTFPDASPQGIIAHLKKEVAELDESHDPEEAADCFLLLMHLGYMLRFNLLREALNKHDINCKRKWGQPDQDGVIEHIREEGDDESEKG